LTAKAANFERFPIRFLACLKNCRFYEPNLMTGFVCRFSVAKKTVFVRLYWYFFTFLIYTDNFGNFTYFFTIHFFKIPLLSAETLSQATTVRFIFTIKFEQTLTIV
jgi:hypothetical protein